MLNNKMKGNIMNTLDKVANEMAKLKGRRNQAVRRIKRNKNIKSELAKKEQMEKILKEKFNLEFPKGELCRYCGTEHVTIACPDETFPPHFLPN